jgi:putative hydrolase of the HAD superfamily
VPRWLLLDYGQVLCTAPPAPKWDELRKAAAAQDAAAFHDLYWHHRLAYDRGDLTATEYWQLVAPDGDLPRLRHFDVAIWLHPHQTSVDAAVRAGERGWHLALLSNAPVEVADAIDGLDWMQFVSHRFYSCRIREVKPAPQSYQHVLFSLKTEPDQVVFLDDRAANVEAAAALGMRAEVYTDPAQIDALEVSR